MSKKITTSDISNRLGISRNTVSKALNNHHGITEETKRKVIEQAVAMGYKKVKLPSLDDPPGTVNLAKSIAYVTKSHLHVSGFWMNVMRGVEQIISSSGYEMKLSFIKEEDIHSLGLPHILGNGIEGFIVAGSITKLYTEKLIDLPLPKVFININPDISLSELNADVVFMENEDSMFRITRHLIQTGHSDIAFIGDISSCRSFLERWLGFQRAVLEAKLTIDPNHFIISDSTDNYQSYEDIVHSLSSMERLPSAFVCVNDRTALHVIKYLNEIGKRVPEDIAVSGFDQINEAEFLGYTLTTVSNDEYQLGVRSAEQLLQRLKDPDRPYETVRLSTKVFFGESTRSRYSAGL
ncbi:LacI family DNA-binding transcriptional regulator [Paenibacillus solisilvae]|uniref:LacI family DNA-binding transcriptional regulator n=1 Tax=Paenibacillus solisilvae TaxID=2486751 RepID=A0ABW0W0S8_9BACL